MIHQQKIAVLITCHNRKETTCRCLAALVQQISAPALDVYLVDDGCTDGTANAVLEKHGNVRVIKGTGDLWWNGGMNLAWQHAIRANVRYDSYLWLNDDVILEPCAIAGLVCDLELLQIHHSGLHIVVGATKDPANNTINYGAQTIQSRRRPLRMSVLKPSGAPQACDTLSGNCVLIPSNTQTKVGILSGRYQHIYGDLDYGLRAKHLGVKLWASSNCVGACGSNGNRGSSLDTNLSKASRLKRRLEEEATIHARDWRTFVRIHSGLGPLSCIYTVTPYLKIIASC